MCERLLTVPEKVRQIMQCYIESIKIWPSKKTGEMILNSEANGLYKQKDRPEGRSCANVIAGAGFEPTTSGL